MTGLFTNTIAESTSGSGITFSNDIVPATPLSHRNMIINGGMIIDQRNSGSAVSPSNGAYTIDRLQTYQAGGGAFSVQQQSTVVPVGFSYSAKINVDTIDSSIASGDYYMLTYNFEGYDTAHLEFGNSNAKTVTLSFYVRSSITGTFGGSITNNAGDRSYPFEYTINSADTWERKTITFQGDQTGTWPKAVNTKSIKIRLAIAMGSTYTASANSWGSGDKYSSSNQVNLMATQNNTFYITGVQLELGSVATPFEFKSFGEELRRCQRYYWKITGNLYQQFAIYHRFNTSNHVFPIHLPVPLRHHQPTINQANLGRWSHPAGSWSTSYTTVTFYDTIDSENNFTLVPFQMTGSSSEDTGLMGFQANGYLSLDAELA
mgnify:CR=1 FL=1